MLQRLLHLLLAALSSVSVLQAQNCPPSVKAAATIKAPVRDVSFDGRTLLLGEDTQHEIARIALTKTVSPEAIENDMQALADEIAERTRMALQNGGYLRAQVETQAVKLDGESGQYSIRTAIRTPYTQFHLGDVSFANATYFPTQQLRDLVPLHEGEIFSREKIEKGLENLSRLYGSQGFINYTGVPETHFDDEDATINLTVNVDQGNQFRVHSINVLGVDSETKGALIDNLSLRPGDLYNSEAWEPVFHKFPDLFLNHNPDAITKQLDEHNGEVDIILDFRRRAPCSPP